MGTNENLTATPATHVLHGSTQDIAKERWAPFIWEEPSIGRCVHGEIAIVRPGGTSGNLTAGFWRTGPTSPGASKNGSHQLVYSAPLGDEVACVLEGAATLTVKATGQKVRVSRGSIIVSPKNVEVLWEIEGPYFKKYWSIFDGSQKVANPSKELKIAHINDNPEQWQPYHYTEPKDGPQLAGELFFIHEGGSTGTFIPGLWRSGKGLPGCLPDGTCRVPYTSVLGDEVILLLEGEVEVIEMISGKRHNFRAGDVIGLSSGMHITWNAKGPFVKKLFLITKDAMPG